MGKWSKYLMALAGAAFLVFGGKIDARAEEAQLPFTAEQLIGVVNAQCEKVNSVRQTLAEQVTLVDVENEMGVQVDMSVELTQSKTVSYTVAGIGMTAAGMGAGVNESMGMEMYTQITDAAVYMYEKETGDENWSVSYTLSSAMQQSVLEDSFNIAGIDTKTAVVEVDGSVIRILGVVDGSYMERYSEILSVAEILADGSFPVILEINAVTLLPTRMELEMNGLKIEEMPGMAVAAHAVVTFSGYNQYDDLAVPAEVVADAL